jgi:phospholipid/cholesterol/gamma-HCH transport system permease protein
VRLIFGPAEYFGTRLHAVISYTFSIFSMVYMSFRTAIKDQKKQSILEILRVVGSQIYFTGFQALPIISWLALIVGTLTIV